MRPGHVMSGSLTDRTLDLLSIEGGWWNSTEIAHRLHANPGSVQKALYRALDRGLVRHRHVDSRRFGTEGHIAEWAAR